MPKAGLKIVFILQSHILPGCEQTEHQCVVWVLLGNTGFLLAFGGGGVSAFGAERSAQKATGEEKYRLFPQGEQKTK